jgi:hypothetical protein
VIDGLDLSAMVKSYRGTGSRRFGGAFLKDIEALFVRVLELAREMGLLKMGMVTLDGTKVHANASRHSALSYEHATKIEAQLKAEVAELLARAEAADQAAVVDGMSVPEELARREDRLAKLAEARARIEARAKERFEQEMAEHRAKLAARGAAAATGKKPAGGHPHRRSRGRGPKDQINLTDADSRIMPVAGGGFDQCYNAQAVVAAESLLVIAAEVVQAPNDKQQIAPEDRRFARNRSAGPKRCWPTAAISATAPPTCSCCSRRSKAGATSRSRTAIPAIDYAHVLKDLANTHFTDAKTIVLVQDNLNIHSNASLYDAFPAAEAPARITLKHLYPSI